MKEYSESFWNRCEVLVSGPIVCSQCMTPRGFTKINKNGQPGKPRQVRLALIHPDWICVPDNVGLFCTRCRKAPLEIKAKRKDIDKLTILMFTEGTNA